MLLFIKEKQIYFWLLLLISIGIGLQVVIYKIAIIALLLQWLLGLGYKHKIIMLKHNNFGVGLIVFYLLYATSFFWSENKEVAIIDMILKTPLLVFPLVILSQKPLPAKLTNQMFLSFALSSLGLNLFCLGSSYFSFLESRQINSFFYDSLVLNMHTSSQSMFTCFSIVLFVYFFKKEKLLSNWMAYLAISFQAIFVLLLSSRIQILIMIVMVPAYLISYYYKRKQTALGLLYTALIFGFSFFIISTPSKLNYRYTKTISQINSIGVDNDNSDPRKLIWSAGIDIIRNNWLIGKGVGGAKDALVARYSELILDDPTAENLLDSTVFKIKQNNQTISYLKEKTINNTHEEELIDHAKYILTRKNNAYKNALQREYNFHNQYLETFGTVGIFGLLLLLYLLGYLFILSIRSKDYLTICFLFIVATSFLTESMFERQAGVAFFSFFYVLLIGRINSNKLS